jgi:hypothetical protein
MKEGLFGDTLRRVIEEGAQGGPVFHVARWIGSQSSRLDVCLLSGNGESITEFATPADADSLRGLARRVRGQRVRAVIESMNGARFVHDMLEEAGWEVLVPDAKKVKGLAPLACKLDKIDARLLAELSWRDLVPAIWLPDPTIRRALHEPRRAPSSNRPAVIQ